VLLRWDIGKDWTSSKLPKIRKLGYEGRRHTPPGHSDTINFIIPPGWTQPEALIIIFDFVPVFSRVEKPPQQPTMIRQLLMAFSPKPFP